MSTSIEILKGLKCLVLDDSRAFAIGLSELLKPFNVEVQIFNKAQDAHHFLENNSVDLIVSDLEMPEVSGFEFIEKVRTNLKFHEIPILVMTGKEDSEIMTKSIAVGADAFCLKASTAHTFTSHLFALARLRLLYKEMTRAKQLDAIKTLIGTYKHEFGNALTIVDGKLRKFLKENPQFIEDNSIKSVQGGVDRFFKTLKQLDELRRYEEVTYEGAAKLLKTG